MSHQRGRGESPKDKVESIWDGCKFLKDRKKLLER